MFLAVPSGRAQTGVGWAGAGVPGEGCATSGEINAQPHEPVCQGLGTGTVLQHPLEGDCPWWQQDIGAPGRFILRVANAHSRLVLLVRCRRAVVETQNAETFLRVDESSACSVQRSAVRETNVGSRARAPPPFLSLPRPG